jgi:hypothetical protein
MSINDAHTWFCHWLDYRYFNVSSDFIFSEDWYVISRLYVGHLLWIDTSKGNHDLIIATSPILDAQLRLLVVVLVSIDRIQLFLLRAFRCHMDDSRYLEIDRLERRYASIATCLRGYLCRKEVNSRYCKTRVWWLGQMVTPRARVTVHLQFCSYFYSDTVM